MKKRKLFWMIAIIVAIITVALIFIGLLFGKGEDEKQNGLSGHFDVSPQGTIAYVNYTDGKPGIYLYNSEQSLEKKVVELENDKLILDPTFANDGSTLTYISTNKDLEEKLESAVHQHDLETKESKELFSAPSAITEIEFSPKGDSLFYLQADVFQNYSPIASKRPHDFDVHEYNIAENEHIQHTDFKKYSMRSLTIAEDGQSVFVQMPDDEEVETAEDSFDLNLRIFQIPLDQPSNLKVVSDPNRKVDIYDFAVVPNETEFIFQSISNQDSGDIFQYELYKYNVETNEEQQLTNLKEYTVNPVISSDNKIYFMVDKRFGQRNADYHLYQMNMDGTEVKEIVLPNIENHQ